MERQGWGRGIILLVALGGYPSWLIKFDYIFICKVCKGSIASDWKVCTTTFQKCIMNNRILEL